MIEFDTALLGAYYTSGASFSASTQRLMAESALARGRGPAVIPPWELPSPAPAENRAVALLSDTSIIDLDNPRLDRKGVDDTFKRLFALYNGLTKMAELADFAASDRSADSMRQVLDRKFQGQMEELAAYLNSEKFDGVTVLQGFKKESMTASAVVQKRLPEMDFKGAAFESARSDPIPNIQDQVFTIDITSVSGPKTVVVDLSLMGDPVANPRNLDNLAAFINDQLAAQSALTRVEVERFAEDSYGLTVVVGTSETAGFRADPANQEPAVYVAGRRGIQDYASGFVRKLDGLAGVAPGEVFRSGIDAEGALDDAASVAVDSRGNVYVVGTTEGVLDGQANPGGQDVYLRKFDSSGQEIFTRLLGSNGGNARGFDIVVDSQDNPIIAGTVTASLTPEAVGGGLDGFVTKFDPSGQELWTYQLAPPTADSMVALAVDGADNIVAAGYQDRAAGGHDSSFVTIDPNGGKVSETTYGGVLPSRVVDIAVAADGSVMTLGDDEGRAVVRKFSDGLVWEADLGLLDSGGTLGGLTTMGGDIFVTGSSANEALNGPINLAHSGGIDAFVARISDLGGAGSVDWVSYLGSATSDAAHGIAVNNGDIYITGETTGLLAGAAMSGATDGFTAKFDGNGALVWTEQFGGAQGEGVGRAIAVDPTGTSVVSRLGLSSDILPLADAQSVTAQSSAREGDHFFVKVNGQSPKRITVGRDDSFTTLGIKISGALGVNGTARLSKVEGGRSLVVTGRAGAEIEILPGREGFNALPGLGFEAGKLFGQPLEGQQGTPSDSVFALELEGEISLGSAGKAGDVAILIAAAQKRVRDAFKFITGAEDPLKNLPKGRAPAYLTSRISNYQEALNRLRAGAVSPGDNNFFSALL